MPFSLEFYRTFGAGSMPKAVQKLASKKARLAIQPDAAQQWNAKQEQKDLRNNGSFGALAAVTMPGGDRRNQTTSSSVATSTETNRSTAAPVIGRNLRVSGGVKRSLRL